MEGFELIKHDKQESQVPASMDSGQNGVSGHAVDLGLTRRIILPKYDFTEDDFTEDSGAGPDKKYGSSELLLFNLFMEGLKNPDLKMSFANEPEKVLLFLAVLFRDLGGNIGDLGNHQESEGLSKWIGDFGKKMAGYAEELMNRIGPKERELVDLQYGRFMVNILEGEMEDYKESSVSPNEIDWQHHFGILGSILGGEYDRVRYMKSMGRSAMAEYSQESVRRGLATLVDAMRMLPPDKATCISIEEKHLEKLGIDPRFIDSQSTTSDGGKVVKVVIPGGIELGSILFSSKSMSLLLPIGKPIEGGEGQSYIELTPDKWNQISFVDKPIEPKN